MEITTHCLPNRVAHRLSSIGSRTGKQGAAYAIIRSRQKHDGGQLAAATLGSDADRRWFYEGDPGRDDVLARCAYDG